jgi:hypothetical protein
MQPFDIAVVTEDDKVIYHQVWAYNEREAERTISVFYKNAITLVGIIFAADDEGDN